MKSNILAALITFGIILFFVGFCLLSVMNVEYTIYVIFSIVTLALVHRIFGIVKFIVVRWPNE